MYRVGRMVWSKPTISRCQRNSVIDTTQRVAAIEAVIAGYDALMRSLAEIHAPEFLEIAVTMPQAKILYLLGAVGDLHMSDLVARLGVSLSTVSGLVDRIVDQGLADPPRGSRRPPPGRRGTDRPGRGLHRPLPGHRRRPDARPPRPRRRRRARGHPATPLHPRPRSRPGVGVEPVPSERDPHEPPLRVRRRQAERHAAAGGRGVHRRASPPGATSSRSSCRTSSSR